MVFGRSLTEQRLISSANYVRTELPTRFVVALALTLSNRFAILLTNSAW